MTTELGNIISGSLRDGFIMRVNPYVDIETIKTGKFVVIFGKFYKFFALITNIKIEVTHPDILLFPPTESETLLTEALKQKDVYASAELRPLLMMGKNLAPIPVKTVPSHFSQVHQAEEKEISLIFGNENDKSKKYFNVGCPLDMDIPICIDLERLTERSNGIFGKTGTGKTFLTRLVLAGLIKKNKAVNIIFDMHSEYGQQARQEGKNISFVKGLKTLFPDKIVICSLDPESTRRRGCSPDISIQIPYQFIQVEDILSLGSELNLHSTALEAAYLIVAKHKQHWLEKLLSQGERLKEFATDLGAHPESIGALYRKLKRIERYPFFTKSGKCDKSVVNQILEYINKEKSIIIEFGNYTSSFCYLLIANIITRRIHSEYVKKTEQFLGSQKPEDEPKKLMVTIEEAHKFLSPNTAKQTIFGTIAREMRKYYVSLLVVDQRPSGIDQEIISQIGTKIIAQLSDEKDIQAALTGANDSYTLRTILASLDSKKQILILGHAIRMPVVVQTREYDELFYKQMRQEVTPKQIDKFIDELF